MRTIGYYFDLEECNFRTKISPEVYQKGKKKKHSLNYFFLFSCLLYFFLNFEKIYAFILKEIMVIQTEMYIVSPKFLEMSHY